MTGVVSNISFVSATSGAITITWVGPGIVNNIFIGLAAWAPSHAYSVVGARVSNGGNVYQLVGTGTSAAGGGPTAIGQGITDGGAIWNFLAPVDFVSLASWVSSIPVTLTQSITGQVWNSGAAIPATAGTKLLTLTGHTTTTAFPIVLTAAPGESFRDTLSDSLSPPFAYSAANGVAFLLPAGTSAISYFDIADQNVIIDGLQFKDPATTGTSSILAANGNNFTLRNCIFDGVSKTGANMVNIGTGVVSEIYNNLFVDRSPGSTASALNSLGVARVVNCDFILPTPNAISVGFTTGTAPGAIARNCIFMGYTTQPLGSTAGTGGIAVDHSMFSIATLDAGGGTTPSDFSTQFSVQFGSTGVTAGITLFSSNVTGTSVQLDWEAPGAPVLSSGSVTSNSVFLSWSAPVAVTTSRFNVSDGGSNIVGALSVNQFDNATTNFRLLPTSAAINAGITDTADVPSADDIIGTHRPASPILPVTGGVVTSSDNQSISLSWVAPLPVSWDIGAWEYFQLALTSANTILALRSVANVQNKNSPVHATISLFAVTGSAQAGQSNHASATNSFFPTRAVASLTSKTFATVRNSIEVMRIAAAMTSATNAAAQNTIEVLSATGVVNQFTIATERQFIIALRSVAQLGQSNHVSALNTFLTITPQIVSLGANLTSATNTIEVITAAASAFRNLAASGRNNLAYAGSGTAIQWAIASNNITFNNISAVGSLIFEAGSFAANNILGLSAAGVIDTNPLVIGANNIMTMRAIATTSRTTFLNSLNTITISAKAVVTQGTSSAGLATFNTMNGSGTASLFDRASALNTIMVITAVGKSSVAATGRASFFPVSAHGTAVQKNPAHSINTITYTLFSPEFGIQTEDTFAIATDPDGTLIEGDPDFTVLTQTTFVSGSASFLPISSVSLVLQGSSAEGLANIDFNVNATILGNFFATAVNNIDLTSHVSVNLSFTGSASFFNLSLFRPANLFIQSDPFNHLILADQSVGVTPLQADAHPLNVTLEDRASGSGTIPTITGGAVAYNGTAISGQQNIDFSVTASSFLDTPASADNTVEVFTGSGTATQADLIQATNTIFVIGSSIVVQVTGTNLVSAVNNVDYSVTNSTTQATSATAVNNIDVTPSITAVSSNIASAIQSFFPVTAIVTAGQSRAANGLATMFTLTANGTLEINASAMSGSALIEVIFVSPLTSVASSTNASGLAEVEVVAETTGHLWVTPIGYVEGESIIYWAD